MLIQSHHGFCKENLGGGGHSVHGVGGGGGVFTGHCGECVMRNQVVAGCMRGMSYLYDVHVVLQVLC